MVFLNNICDLYYNHPHLFQSTATAVAFKACLDYTLSKNFAFDVKFDFSNMTFDMQFRRLKQF